MTVTPAPAPAPPAEPQHDPDALIKEARRRQRLRRLSFAALAIAGAAIAIGVYLGFVRSHSTTASQQPPPSALVGPSTTSGFIAYKCGDSLCLARPNGSRQRYLLSSGPWPQWDPAITPNGRLVAFRGYYAPPADGAYALYVTDTNGCNVRRLTRSIAGNPSWSPDGKWIVFDTSGAGEIWKVRPNGTGLTRVAYGGLASSPAWSPDGTKIAFTRNAHGRSQIWTMNPDGSNATLIHSDRHADDQAPAWSHDGKRIAFVAQAWPRAAIKVMNANGSDVRVLTRQSGHAWNPAWLARDSGIAFLAGLANAVDQATLFAMRPDGSGVHRVGRLHTEQFAWVDAPMPARHC
jgi:Tol biopolymer transport system component